VSLVELGLVPSRAAASPPPRSSLRVAAADGIAQGTSALRGREPPSPPELVYSATEPLDSTPGSNAFPSARMLELRVCDVLASANPRAEPAFFLLADAIFAVLAGLRGRAPGRSSDRRARRSASISSSDASSKPAAIKASAASSAMKIPMPRTAVAEEGVGDRDQPDQGRNRAREPSAIRLRTSRACSRETGFELAKGDDHEEINPPRREFSEAPVCHPITLRVSPSPALPSTSHEGRESQTRLRGRRRSRWRRKTLPPTRGAGLAGGGAVA